MILTSLCALARLLGEIWGESALSDCFCGRSWRPPLGNDMSLPMTSFIEVVMKFTMKNSTWDAWNKSLKDFDVLFSSLVILKLFIKKYISSIQTLSSLLDERSYCRHLALSHLRRMYICVLSVNPQICEHIWICSAGASGNLPILANFHQQILVRAA